MATVKNVDELKQALSSKESEIVISDPALSKKVDGLKNISSRAMGIVIASGLVFVIHPLIAIATLGIMAVWIGRGGVEIMFALGKDNVRELYFNYETKLKIFDQYTLARK